MSRWPQNLCRDGHKTYAETATKPVPRWQQNLCRDSHKTCAETATKPVPRWQQNLCRDSHKTCAETATKPVPRWPQNLCRDGLISSTSSNGRWPLFDSDIRIEFMGLQEAKKNTKEYLCNSVILYAVTSLFIQKAALHLHTSQLSQLLKQVKVQRQNLEHQRKWHT